MCLTGRRKATKRKPLRVQLNDEKVKNTFQNQQEELFNLINDIHPEVAWYDNQNAAETAVIYTSSLNQKIGKNQWIS